MGPRKPFIHGRFDRHQERGKGLLWAPMNGGFGWWVDVGFVGVRMGLERVFFRWVIGYIAREHLLHNGGKFVSCSWFLC